MGFIFAKPGSEQVQVGRTTGVEQGAQGQNWGVLGIAVGADVDAQGLSAQTSAQQHRDGDAGWVRRAQRGMGMGVQRAQAAVAQ